MTRIQDPIRTRPYSDRLHYATGELLGADDFRDEQTYHRGQLARALCFLHGYGAIAGLRVMAKHQPGSGGRPDEVELEVEPGLALDRIGRMIEVPRNACLRLRRWFEFGAGRAAGSEGLDRDDLRDAWRADGNAAGGAVVADVFLTFHPCDRGHTPAFASGPFDALDASQPSRIRDAYELSLVPRPEADADLPTSGEVKPWWDPIAGGTVAERLASARALNLDAWSKLAPPPDNPPDGFHENPAGVDPTAVLLARLRLPAASPPNATSAPGAVWTAAAWPDAGANIDNTVRNLVLPPAALLRIANG